MMSYSDLTEKLATHLHNQWKNFAHPLLTGGHISESKRHQYSRGMCDWNLLEERYKQVYRHDADDILRLCMSNVDTLLDESFNGGNRNE